jgi:hypothetical protein
VSAMPSPACSIAMCRTIWRGDLTRTPVTTDRSVDELTRV